MAISQITAERDALAGRPYASPHFTYPPLDYRSPPDIETILHGPDRRYFMEFMLKIPTQAGLRRMKLFPWMHEIAQGQITRHELMLKSREIGSSTFWVAYFLRDVLTKPGGNLVIVANKEDNARNLLDYAKTMVLNLPDGVRPTIGKMNESEIAFPVLGNHIKAVPGNPEACRSERAMYLICTEVAFWEKQEELWAAVQGVLVPGGYMATESTANSESDIFHDLFYDSLNPFRKHFFGWKENPTHNLDWYASKRRIIKEDFLFYREYPGTPAEAFQSAGDIHFYLLDIDRGQKDITQPLHAYPIVRDGVTYGQLKVWKAPMAGHDYVIGSDVAEGIQNDRGRPDYSVAYVLDQLTGEPVAVIYCRLPVDEYARELYDLGKTFNTALMGIERNGPGLAVIHVLKQLKYGDENFFYHRRFEAVIRGANRPIDEIGWHTTSLTKPRLIGELNDAMHQGAWICREPLFWEEAKSFGKDLRAKSTSHDDHIMAAAIAWWVRNHNNRQQSQQRLDEYREAVGSGSSWKGMWGSDLPRRHRRRRT